MKLKTKLAFSFTLLITIVIGLSVSALSIFLELRSNMDLIVNDRYAKVKLVTKARAEVNNLNRELISGFLQTTGDSPFDQAQIPATANRVRDLLNELHKLNYSDQGDVLLEDVSVLYKEYEGLVLEIQKRLSRGEKPDTVRSILAEAEKSRQRLFNAIEIFNLFQENKMNDSLAHMDRLYKNTIVLCVIFIIIALVFGSLLAWWTMKSIMTSLRKVVAVMDSATRSELIDLPRINLKVKDEISQIADAYNRLVEELETHSRSEKEAKELLEHQNRVKTVLAETTLQFQGVQDSTGFGDSLFRILSPMIGLCYGAFYIREGSGESGRLVLATTFARSGKLDAEASFALGEGLPGQCVQEERWMKFTSVPESYYRICSGTGSDAPRNLLLIPVRHGGVVTAVLELAFWEELTPLQEEVLEELINRSAGITLDSILKHMQVQKLLSDTQLYVEELQSQSEELQQQQEELRTLNEKLEEQYRSSEDKNQELEEIGRQLETKAREVELGSRYKSEFLANMSHELRTPLNSLLILAQLLAENKEGNLTGQQVEFVETIRSSGSDLLKLINEVLDLSKIEAGKVEVIKECIPVERLLEELRMQFEPVASRKGLEFRVDVAEELKNWELRLDEQKVLQILRNLVSNALKFTEQGSVTIELNLAAEPSPNSSGGSPLDRRALSVRVKDTGIGIPKDKQELVFEAFRQADGTTSRKYGGTGLGLAISRELADLMGAVIEVESEEGQGSTFTLYLPLEGSTVPVSLSHRGSSSHWGEAAAAIGPAEAPEAEANPTEAPVCSTDSKGTILIVDDDMRNIYALTSFLESRGYRVVFRENGAECLDFLGTNPEVDLILMDIMMPEMDGYEAMRRIRQLPTYSEIPMIALTAKAMKNDRDLCIQAGANDYLSKPVRLEQLLSLISVWVQR